MFELFDILHEADSSDFHAQIASDIHNDYHTHELDPSIGFTDSTDSHHEPFYFDDGSEQHDLAIGDHGLASNQETLIAKDLIDEDGGANHHKALFADTTSDPHVNGFSDWWRHLFHEFQQVFSPEHTVTIGGDPDSNAEYWHVQEGNNSCAVAAQTCVLESIYNRHFDEGELANIASEHGWYTPEGGTRISDVGKLLEYYNVPVERHSDFTFTEIYDAVQKGEKVIVGLNANEIWTPQHDTDGKPLQLPPGGHAVWVTGFDMNEEGKVSVVLNDTGTQTGQESKVAVEDFRNAWSDYSNFAVITHLNS